MEKNQQMQETIDMKKFMHIICREKKTVGAIVGSCTTLALIVAFILPKTYESTTLVQTRSADKMINGTAAMMAASMGLGGQSSQTLSYIELMKSRTVLEPIIEQMEWDDKKKKPEVKEFVKKYIEIENTKQTNLLTVTAKGKTPEEAQMISQSVVDNFLAMQTDKSQQTQSLLVKFFDGRIEDAKKDAEEARAKFAEYQQTHKVYSPDAQTKAAVTKMAAFDEALTQMMVQQKAEQAKLDTVSAKLGDMRASSLNFNINDNENVIALRKQIVDTQLELVNLRERYTEEHPNVVSAKEKLEELEKQLTKEVDTIVASKYTTMNPAQAKLVGEEANAQANMAVAVASESAIRTRRDEKEKELEKFPEDVLGYLNLQRDTAIKEEIYTNLVKQREQSKIKEAMESMDVQIIDPANLPDEDKPASPRKKLYTAVGLIIGCLISFCYGFIQYKREEV
ncbi:Uncharacterized protein involved in exopolysaccharide biosynthesis [Selenomonas ruminantium]|uniref:Uncharacterized protein involved in exopolysaccharide biosynthesis n=1 Tax=Selenomonas ruminantium TaxID=971 RepID=A0A1M6X3U8_SELRU|nr:GumC family protein [Selenomonas ruminantium]SHL00732.1 Uncharacterized protein involved in exopolysaccharide biosynthesis [Selenomonas ruminantium]